MTIQTLLSFLLPLLGAAGAGGIIVALINYYANKPENVAKAKSTNISAELSLAEGYKKYIDDMEARLKKQIQDLQDTIERKEIEQSVIVATKDEEIKELKSRVKALEDELHTYKNK